VEYVQSRRLVDAFFAQRLLSGLENHYPDFGHWFVNRCMPGIVAGDDLMILAKEHGRVVGVALGKRGDAETKLRCVRVSPELQSRGVGLHLIDRMLRALDCDKPHCTVSEEMLHLYSRAFVNRYGFDLSSVDKGLYRPGKLEYIFNRPLGAESLKPSPL
jgi:GNAT superfamily N-acetyltransferase